MTHLLFYWAAQCRQVMSQSNIIMYTTEDGLTKIEATFDEDTVWLSMDQMRFMAGACRIQKTRVE